MRNTATTLSNDSTIMNLRNTSKPLPVPPSISGHNELLLDAAVRGDDEAVRTILIDGADINATNDEGRSVLSLAIAGPNFRISDASDASFLTPARLNTIRLLVEHPNVSLHVLNAPEDALDGVTPLGVAAWLNAPDVVRILLDSGAGAVSANGLDTHRATPLMYAARDGSLEVVQHLLAHGARPNCRDDNGHTSMWFALQHIQVLWLCENEVRKHRTLECQTGNRRNLSPPARLAIDSLLVDDIPFSIPDNLSLSLKLNPNTLLNAIVSADLLHLRELLFPPLGAASPPVLVNAPDSNGWSPIHYCASSALPSIEVLDTLYRAGADVGLFSKFGNSTPLHCLARKKRGSHVLRGPVVAKELYEFVIHLCKDLEAPMRACAEGGETCMHVAAEMGDSVDVLKALLECDVDGTVREMRNERGLTPLEVAKPEFRFAFGTQAESTRSSSPASFRTIRPSYLQSASPTTPTARNLTLPSPSPTTCSLPRVSTPVSAIPTTVSSTSCDTASPSSPHDIATSATTVINSLRIIHNELSSTQHPLISDLDRLAALLRSTKARSTALLGRLRSKIDEASEELKGGQEEWKGVDVFLDAVSQAYEDKVKELKRIEEDALEAAAALAPTEPWSGRARSGTTVSYESQVTAVDSIDSYSTGPPLTPSSERTPEGDSDQHSFFHFDGDDERTHTPPQDDDPSSPLKVPWPAWIDRFDGSPRSASYNAHFLPHKSSPSPNSRSRSSSRSRSNTPNSSNTQTTSIPSGPIAALSSSKGHASQGSGSSTPSLKSYRSMGELRKRPKHFSFTKSGGSSSPTRSTFRGSPSPPRPTASVPLTRQVTPRPRAETNASARSVKFPEELEVPTVKARARAGSLLSATVTATTGLGAAVAAQRTVTEDGMVIVGKGDSRKERARAKSESGGVERGKGHKHDEQREVKGSGSGTGKIKAWFRKTLNLKPLAPVAEQPARLAVDAEAEGRISLTTTLCEPESSAASGKRMSLSGTFPYRAFAAASKDLARMDERMSNAEKFLAAAYRRVTQAQHIIDNALRARERTILEFRAANSVDAGLEAFLSHRDSRSGSPPPILDEFIEFPSISASSSPPFSLNSSVQSSAQSSVSSLALPHVRMDGGRGSVDSSVAENGGDEEDDTKGLHALLTRKVDVRVEAAMEEVEVVKAWLGVVKEVVRDVQKRVGLRVPQELAL